MNERTKTGFTQVELLVIMAALLVVCGMLLPALCKAKVRTKRLGCANCEKQIGLAFRLFATDNADRFPMEASTNEGGTKEFNLTGDVYRHFLIMSNELGDPRVLVCPDDPERMKHVAKVAVHNFSDPGFNNACISYFVGVDSVESNMVSILSGDRNVVSNGKRTNGVLTLKPGMAVGWDDRLHQNSGYLLFGDGSVWPFTNMRLSNAVAGSQMPVMRWAIPE